MNKSELIAIRDSHESDKSFIYATFLRGLYYGETVYSEMPKSLFMHHYHGIVDAILAKHDVLIRVACLKDDPEVILGYSILSNTPNVAHWVFVKKSWRGISIAKALVPETVTTATHLTKVGLSIIRKKGIVFNPFAL